MSQDVVKVESPRPPIVRVWDKDFNLVGAVFSGWRIDEPNVVVVPLDNRVAQWLLSDPPQRGHVTLTADCGGLRHVARMREFRLTRAQFGDGQARYVRVVFEEEREYLKEL